MGANALLSIGAICYSFFKDNTKKWDLQPLEALTDNAR